MYHKVFHVQIQMDQSPKLVRFYRIQVTHMTSLPAVWKDWNISNANRVPKIQFFNKNMFEENLAFKGKEGKKNKEGWGLGDQ